LKFVGGENFCKSWVGYVVQTHESIELGRYNNELLCSTFVQAVGRRTKVGVGATTISKGNSYVNLL